MQRTYAPKVIAKPRPVSTPPLTWMIVAIALVVGLMVVVFISVILGIAVLFGSGRILPGVSTAGMNLHGLMPAEAAALLNDASITVRDGQRSWQITPAQFGITLDGDATAQRAEQDGRSEGSFMAALVGAENVTPVLSIDPTALQKGVDSFASIANIAPSNATIHLVNGTLKAIPSVTGRQLDVNATVAHLKQSAADDLASGALNLVMVSISPTIQDATPLLDRAKTLLASPLVINAYDAIANQKITWTVEPIEWGTWLSTDKDMHFSVDRTALTNFLKAQNVSNRRYLNIDQSIDTIQAAVASGTPDATIRLLNPSTQYQVKAGDTVESIAWSVGIPYWQISKVNPNASLSAGQIITIPSKDVNLPLPVVDGKRIVVSITHQHMTVYDNGQVKWDWAASTGISSSPTMPGIYQIQSHEINAYAGNWNLYMPNFMGIYDAVPGFTNGIHGFPTRNGYGLLWQGDLGHKVTYGCILVSSQNAQLLYNWAQDGVVVEVQS